MDRSPLRQLGSGPALLAFRGVSAKMRPETALLRSVSTPSAFRVLEQNFDFDLLTPQKLLERYVGKNVTVVGTNPATGVETTESATVLATNGGVVLQMGQRIETGVPGRLVFGDVPANLRDCPTLVMGLDNSLHLRGIPAAVPELWRADAPDCIYYRGLADQEDSGSHRGRLRTPAHQHGTRAAIVGGM